MIRIRSATPEDLPALIPLYRAFFILHRRFLGNPERLTDAEAMEIAQEALQEPQSWLIVAEEVETEQVVGFARWEERDGAFFGRELFVRPECRNQGIGTRLLEEVEQRLREAGADVFFISVLPHNGPMLTFAYQRGYNTLNTVELRKELAGARPRRSQVTLLGLEFKII